GGTTDVNCQVINSGGQPQAGVNCTFTVVSQPGSDAGFVSGNVSSLQAGYGVASPARQTLTSVTKPTNANGVATASLIVGTTPGPVVVAVEANGIISQVTVQAS